MNADRKIMLGENAGRIIAEGLADYITSGHMSLLVPHEKVDEYLMYVGSRWIYDNFLSWDATMKEDNPFPDCTSKVWLTEILQSDSSMEDGYVAVLKIEADGIIYENIECHIPKDVCEKYMAMRDNYINLLRAKQDREEFHIMRSAVVQFACEGMKYIPLKEYIYILGMDKSERKYAVNGIVHNMAMSLLKNKYCTIMLRKDTDCDTDNIEIIPRFCNEKPESITGFGIYYSYETPEWLGGLCLWDYAFSTDDMYAYEHAFKDAFATISTTLENLESHTKYFATDFIRNAVKEAEGGNLKMISLFITERIKASSGVEELSAELSTTYGNRLKADFYIGERKIHTIVFPPVLSQVLLHPNR